MLPMPPHPDACDGCYLLLYALAAEQGVALEKTEGAQTHPRRTSGRSRGANRSYREPEVGLLWL